jgi:hypothetical protein
VQIPTFGFLYVAGYIGYVGRQYLIAARSTAKPTDKEIIIDVPLAVKLAWQGAGWPLAAVQVREQQDAGGRGTLRRVSGCHIQCMYRRGRRCWH